MEALKVGQRVMVEMVVTQYSHWLDKNCDAKDFWCLKPVANGYGNGTITLHASDIHPLPTGEGWQPIATAPKDGTQIILGYNYEGYLFTCSDGRWTECNGQGGWVRNCMFQPTCWMPLTIPPPPQQTEATP